MPAYNYVCHECESNFEVRKPMSEIDTETRCPACGSVLTNRKISNVTIFSFSDGVRRPQASASSCSGCSTVGSGCAACRSG
jgi:putative FmdB family regulatory protein